MVHPSRKNNGFVKQRSILYHHLIIQNTALQNEMLTVDTLMEYIIYSEATNSYIFIKTYVHTYKRTKYLLWGCSKVIVLWGDLRKYTKKF